MTTLEKFLRDERASRIEFVENQKKPYGKEIQ